jgi:hypothetical protein
MNPVPISLKQEYDRQGQANSDTTQGIQGELVPAGMMQYFLMHGSIIPIGKELLVSDTTN